MESLLAADQAQAIERLRVLCADTSRPVAVIPAAGKGERSGLAVPKQYHRLAGSTMLAHSVRALAAFEPLAAVVVVLDPNDSHWHSEKLDDALRGLGNVVAVRAGGPSRRASVMAGCELIAQAVGSNAFGHASPWVFVHDAARPGLTHASLERLWGAVTRDQTGAILAMPVTDTVKSRDPNTGQASVARTIDRSLLWAAQTPQVFTLADLLAAYASHPEATDEASAIEAQGGKVLLITGDAVNLKVTQSQDFELMEAIMSQLKGKPLSPSIPMAIGQGFDVHALVEGRPLIIGGIEIPFPKGLAGHSDADVLLHAISDAILGAACMGDIGRHFPDTDPAYRGADSKKLLAEVVRKVSEAGWSVAQIDATVIAQAPKIAPHAARMQQAIGECCAMDPSQVNIKGKTTESLGFTGRGEGIAAQAVAMLMRRPSA